MDSNNTSSCANCGKGEENSIVLKKCGACKMVKYCSLACQKAHRSQHKKECKKRAAELHEEALFKQPPPNEDCPICMLPFPLDSNKTHFEPCCGRVICSGCIFAMEMSEGGDICAFCRASPAPSLEESIKRLEKLMDKGNGEAYCKLGSMYNSGCEEEVPQDYQKAHELWLKAGELGCSSGYYNLASNYHEGKGVEINKRKARQYFELAAINGHLVARHNLGTFEIKAENYNLAVRHFLIAAKAGYEDSLEGVKIGYETGLVTKDEYANTLRAYQKIQDETKSEMRDKAAGKY